MSTASSNQQAADPTASSIEVDGHDLPVACPGPHTPLWNMHPKVFLDVATSGQAMCPYCGTEYRLKAGAKVHAH